MSVPPGAALDPAKDPRVGTSTFHVELGFTTLLDHFHIFSYVSKKIWVSAPNHDYGMCYILTTNHQTEVRNSHLNNRKFRDHPKNHQRRAPDVCQHQYSLLDMSNLRIVHAK